MQQQDWFEAAEWGDHAAEMEFLLAFTRKAGERLLAVPVCDRGGSSKPDGTPVTAGDSETNAAFIEAVAERFPGEGVIGEEASSEPVDSRLWTIDPIDGTRQYMTGLPLWAIGIALIVDGEPVASTVHFPETRRWYMASTKRPGAYRNGAPIIAAPRPTGVVAGSGVDRRREPTIFDPLMAAAVAPERPLRLEKLLHTIPTMARGCAVADGGIDGTVYGGKGAWDIAPLVPIIRGVGKKLTDKSGNPQRYDRPINGAVISRGEPHHAGLVASWRYHVEKQAAAIDEHD